MYRPVVTSGPGKHYVFWLRSLGSMALTTVWVLESIWASILTARAVGFPMALPGPVARDQGTERWWPEPPPCTSPAAEASCRSLCSSRVWLQTYTHVVAGAGQAARAGAHCRHAGSEHKYLRGESW